jgi:hypothetical protein
MFNGEDLRGWCIRLNWIKDCLVNKKCKVMGTLSLRRLEDVAHCSQEQKVNKM